jgi:predicted metal-dependent hydrolase
MKNLKLENEEFFTNEKYCEFIEYYEDNWIQYATVNEKMKAYFGDIKNAVVLFKKWRNSENIWEMRKKISWHLDNKKNLN